MKGVAMVCVWAMAFPAGIPAAQHNASAAVAMALPQQAAKTTTKQCEVNSSLTGPLIKARKLYRTGKFDEASAANQAMELTPGRAPAIVALGEVYYRQGKFADAEMAFVKPIQNCDLDARAFWGLYRVHAASRNMKHAKMDIDQAFKLDPNDPDIQRAYFGTLSIDERIQSLKKDLAQAGDEATKADTQKELDALEERKASPKNACRLATPVKSTEAPLERLFESGQRISGFGLSMKIN